MERDPFDKAISRYYWNTRDDEQRRDVFELLDGLPQKELSSWEIYTIDDNIVVDRMLRFENLATELEEVRQALGLPDPLELSSAKGSHRRDAQHYSALLSPRCRALIEARCEREIAAFGYGWREGPNLTAHSREA